MIGCVGGDAHGVRLREGLDAAGVDVSTLDVEPDLPSGMALVTVDAAGQNQIVVVPGANGALAPERLERSRSLLASAAVVRLQLEIPLATVRAVAGIAHANGALVILDPAPAQRLPDDVLADVHYVTPNVTELLALTADADAANGHTADGDVRAAAVAADGVAVGTDTMDPGTILTRASRLLSRGAGGVIVKAGWRGRAPRRAWPRSALARAPDDGGGYHGGGDTFNAALAVALTEGTSIDAAGDFACAAASLSVGRRGARSGMPTRAEVMALVRAAR